MMAEIYIIGHGLFSKMDPNRDTKVFYNKLRIDLKIVQASLESGHPNYNLAIDRLSKIIRDDLAARALINGAKDGRRVSAIVEEENRQRKVISLNVDDKKPKPKLVG